MDTRRKQAIGYLLLKNFAGNSDSKKVSDVTELMFGLVEKSEKNIDLPQSKRNQMAYDALIDICAVYPIQDLISTREDTIEMLENWSYSLGIRMKEARQFYMRLVVDLARATTV